MDPDALARMMTSPHFQSWGGVVFQGTARFFSAEGSPLSDRDVQIEVADGGAALVWEGHRSALEGLTSRAACALAAFVANDGGAAFSIMRGEAEIQSLKRQGFIASANGGYVVPELVDFSVDDLSLASMDTVDSELWIRSTEREFKAGVGKSLKLLEADLRETELQIEALSGAMNSDMPVVESGRRSLKPVRADALSPEVKRDLTYIRGVLGDDQVRAILQAKKERRLKDIARAREDLKAGAIAFRSRILTSGGWGLWDDGSLKSVNRGQAPTRGLAEVTYVNTDVGVVYDVYVGGTTVDVANLPFRIVWGRVGGSAKATLVADFPYPPEVEGGRREYKITATVRAFHYAAIFRSLPVSTRRVDSECRTRPP